MEDRTNLDRSSENAYGEEKLDAVLPEDVGTDSEKDDMIENTTEKALDEERAASDEMSAEALYVTMTEGAEQVFDENEESISGDAEEDLEAALDIILDSDTETKPAATSETKAHSSAAVAPEEDGNRTSDASAARRPKARRVVKLKSRDDVPLAEPSEDQDAEETDELEEMGEMVSAELLQKVAKDTSHAKRREVIRLIVGRVFSFITLLIISMCISFLAWSYVFNIDSTEFHKTIRVPVETVNELTGDSFKLYAMDQGYVDVTIVGKRSELYDIDSSNIADYISCYVDLSKISTAGDSLLDVESKVMDTGLSMTVESVSPATLTVFADKEETVTVSVKDMIKYQLNSPLYEEYSVKVVVNTDKMSLTGPSTLLSNIDSVAIVEDLGSISESRYINSVPFVLLDKDGNQVVSDYIVPEISAVNVRFEVTTVRLIPVVVVCGENAEGLSATAAQSIKLAGDPKVLDGLRDGVVVNTDELFAGETISGPTIKSADLAKIPLPEGVTLAKGSGTILNVSFEYAQEISVEE